jgi:hypothetical protein
MASSRGLRSCDRWFLSNGPGWLIDCNAHCKNQGRIYQDYEVGDDVLVKVYNPAGLEHCSVSPFTVE